MSCVMKRNQVQFNLHTNAFNRRTKTLVHKFFSKGLQCSARKMSTRSTRTTSLHFIALAKPTVCLGLERSTHNAHCSIECRGHKNLALNIHQHDVNNIEVLHHRSIPVVRSSRPALSCNSIPTSETNWCQRGPSVKRTQSAQIPSLDLAFVCNSIKHNRATVASADKATSNAACLNPRQPGTIAWISNRKTEQLKNLALHFESTKSQTSQMGSAVFYVVSYLFIFWNGGGVTVLPWTKTFATSVQHSVKIHKSCQKAPYVTTFDRHAKNNSVYFHMKVSN